MTQLIIEILTEEVPFEEQKNQKDAVLKFFSQKQELKGNLEVFNSRLRLVIILSNCEEKLIIPAKTLKGPSVSAPQVAIDGFLSKTGAKMQELKEENGFLTFTTKEEVQDVKILLETSILEEFFNFVSSSFSQTMMWNDTKKKWIRPIKEIKTSFNGNVLNFEFAGIKAQKFESLHLESEVLKAEERFEIIKNGILKVENQHNIKCLSSEKLLWENCFLSSLPNVRYGIFDEKYLKLPEKVLIQTLEKNQKYFLFRDGNGGLSNIFAICINGNYTEEVIATIIEGNKKVLNARLEDALYYIKIDARETLLEHLEKTKKVTFHTKVGTVFERIPKMLAIAEKIDAKNEDLKTAIKLCKADLQTEMTQSFTELQGYIGAFYAKNEGYSNEICDAILNQYKLGGEEEAKGRHDLSLKLALIEKYEKIVSLVKAGEIPTSSRDPFGIRKDALALIKIIVEGGLEVALYFEKSVKSIVLDRLKFYLKTFQNEAVMPVLNFDFNEKSEEEISILQIYKKVSFLNENLTKLNQFQRIVNILSSKDALPFKGKNLEETSLMGLEKDLFTQFKNAKNLEEMLNLSHLIDDFFEGNLVIDFANQEISKRRVALLEFVHSKINLYLHL
jgi:glycyl-tRNA synthetase beta chain